MISPSTYDKINDKVVAKQKQYITYISSSGGSFASFFCPPSSKLPPSLFIGQVIGQVVGVIDGDTIEVLHTGKRNVSAYQGIDCPEKRQLFGDGARIEFTDWQVAISCAPLRLSGPR